MYKLVAIAGKLRGQEFSLEEGENIIGRDSGCTISLSLNGVSKKHAQISITGDSIFIEDLGSSNGTFVNDLLIKKSELKSGDRVAIPDVIFQVIQVQEKKVFIQKEVENEAPTEVGVTSVSSTPPASPFKKIIYYFKAKVMPIFYGMNEEYEWRVIFGIILTIFVVITITLTIFPILQDSRTLLTIETAKRASSYADVIERTNAVALREKQLDSVDTSFLEREDGVVYYELFDLEGRIVRPQSKMNEYIADIFSIKVLEEFNKKRTHQIIKELGEGELGVARQIVSMNPKTSAVEPVGIISLRFKPQTLAVEAVKNSQAYLESLITSAIVGIIFFAIMYYVTLRPIDELKGQIDDALRGKRQNVESKYLMYELVPLRDSINALLQRVIELKSDGQEGDFSQTEDDGPYLTMLGEIFRTAGCPAMVLNSDKNLKRINQEGEDLTGIRESASIDQNILEISREKGFAATVTELCDLSAGNGGTCQTGEYELGGRSYQINVVASIGKDSFSKGYYITFVQNS